MARFVIDDRLAEAGQVPLHGRVSGHPCSPSSHPFRGSGAASARPSVASGRSGCPRSIRVPPFPDLEGAPEQRLDLDGQQGARMILLQLAAAAQQVRQKRLVNRLEELR